MPVTPTIQSAKGTGVAGTTWRGQASKAANQDRADIDRVMTARDRVATLLANGELWALPLFTRLEAELVQLTAHDDTLARARQIAEIAARKAA